MSDETLVERLERRWPRHAAQSWEKVGDDWEPGLVNRDGPGAASRIRELEAQLAEAREAERAAVVAWLKREGEAHLDGAVNGGDTEMITGAALKVFADAIERGDHLHSPKAQ